MYIKADNKIMRVHYISLNHGYNRRIKESAGYSIIIDVEKEYYSIEKPDNVSDEEIMKQIMEVFTSTKIVESLFDQEFKRLF